MMESSIYKQWLVFWNDFVYVYDYYFIETEKNSIYYRLVNNYSSCDIVGV